MNTLLKRIISLVLCLVMVVGYVPVNAFADETGEAVSTEATEAPLVVTDEGSEPDEPGKPADPKGPGKEEKPEKPGKPEKEEKPGKPEKEEKPGKPEKEEKPGKPEHEKPGKPEAPKTEQEEPPVTEEIVPSVIAVTGITLDQTALEVAVGAVDLALTATVQPEEATDKTVTWTSSEPGVASVDENGALTIGYMGEATITATAGEFSASCTVTVGEGEMAAYVPEVREDFVDAAIFFSDLHIKNQTKNGMDQNGTLLNNILTKIKETTGMTYSSVTSCGDAFAVNNDTDGGGQGKFNGDTATLNTYITSAVGNGVDINYVWADHDRYAVVNGSYLEKTSGLVYGAGGDGIVGTSDDDNYYVYALCHADTSTDDRYGAGFFSQAEVEVHIDDFVKLAGKMDKTKPLFIAAHQPLLERRKGDKVDGPDNVYAALWAPEINNIAAQMDVAYFFGHNHKHDEKSDYYTAKDSSMNIAGLSEDMVLNFPHICVGYMEPTSTGAYTRKNVALNVAIYDDEIAYTIFDKNGILNSSTAEYNLDVTVTRAHTVADQPSVPDPTPEGYALARVEVVNQGTTKYFLNDALDTENLVVEAVYTKEDAADVRKVLTLQTAENEDGYTVSGFDMSNAGKQYVTVTYNGLTGSYAIEVFKTRFENAAGTVAVDFTNLGITSVAITEKPKEVEGYTAYVTYDITPVGYTQGDEATVTIALDTSLFDVTRPVKVLDQGNVIADCPIVDGKITFTTNHFSEYDVAQVDADAQNWIDIPGGNKTIFRLTNSLTSGKKYVIVSTNAAGAATATNLNGSNINTTTVTIIADDDGNYIEAPDTTAQWTYASSRFQNVSNTARYLRGNNNALSTTNKTSDTYITWSLNNGALRARQYANYGNSYRYMTSVTGTSGSSSNRVYLYVEDTINTATTYAALGGQQNQSYATSANTSLDAVLSKLVVYTSADKAVVDEALNVTASMVTWDKAFDGSTAGTYTGTVKYNNITLGSVTVAVVDKVAQSVTLNKNEGTVERESGADAATGAYLNVTWLDGTTEQIPVVVGMLSGSYNVNKNGSYTGLTISYGGETFENFTLNVVNKTGVNDFPQYPNPGSIDLKKSATGVDFQNTGIARVELSTSGLPSEKGVDVVVVIDTSSSMKKDANGNDKSTYLTDGARYKIMTEALEDMLTVFSSVNPTTGVKPDIDLAIVDFNGFSTSPTNNNSNNFIPHSNVVGDSTTNRTNANAAKIYTGPDAGKYILNAGLGAKDFVNTAASSFNVNDIITKFTGGSSGTNYDFAFESAYKLLDAKKTANGAESRDQYVIFMTDGAPFRYNGFTANNSDGREEMNQLLRGDFADTNALKNKFTWMSDDVLAMYNKVGDAHLHRMAEAIKGTPGNTYYAVDSTNSSPYLKPYTGLGATMYSIGFCLADDVTSGTSATSPERVEKETSQKLVRDISSGSGYYWDDVTDADTLKNAFNKIASDIAYAASNARFVDQMGDSFNLQLNPTIDTNNPDTADENGQTTTNTNITITTRHIYTKEQVNTNVGGHMVTTNDIGKPYGNSDPLEDVRFSVDNGVLKATTSVGGYTIPDGNGGTQTVTANSTNILVGNVIYGKNFFYNNNNAAVNIKLANGSTYSLPGETFYWNIGTINETQYTISYTVYLEGSMDEGTVPADSYETNNFAILYYTNHVGNEVSKSVASPSLAWEGANVSYAFYLVNDEGKPVYADGTTAPNFLQAHKITQPVVYQSVELNDDEGATLTAAALAVLPAGYELYAPSAVYHVEIGSGAGEGANPSFWQISGDSDNTTYVVGFGESNEYSNDQSVYNTNEKYTDYDYTHTTVYFAVKWVIGAVQDTVVIDYGLPVDINVMYNDMFGDDGTLHAVGPRDNKPDKHGTILATGFNTNSVNGTYGTAALNNGKIRYTLNDMQIKGAEKLAYAVDYQGEANKGFYYGDLTVIPATTVYYEDEYVTLKTYTRPDTTTTNYTSVEGWPTDSVAANGVQAEDRPGSFNLDIIDANNIYGFDQAYEKMSTHSMGNSAMIHVDAKQYGTAEFSFWGTGFDVISNTSNTTGTMVVQIYDSSNKLVKSSAVDTYYGYTYGLYTMTYQKNADGIWVLTHVGDASTDVDSAQTKQEITSGVPNEDGTVTGLSYTWKPVTNDPNALYQVPVIQHSGLPYGNYKVKITALYYETFDATTVPGYDLYLDAIRIYNPAGTGTEVISTNNNKNTTIADIYAQDGEAWPEYHELRNLIIEAATFDSLGAKDEVEGIIFIDGNEALTDGNSVTGSAITDYKNFGPNNELYLAKDQAVAFNMNLGDTTTHPGYVPVVRIGLKTVGGETAVAEMWNAVASNGTVTRYNAISDELKTATDMYYDISVLNGRTVVIKNSGEAGSILSITNIKLTYKPTTTSTAGINEANTVTEPDIPTGRMFTISRSAANAALMTLAEPQVEIPETPAPEETVPETTVPEETVPEETKPAKPDSSDLKESVEAAKALKEKDYTKDSYKAVKSALKAAEKVLKDKKASQAKIEAALEALNDAIAALEAKPDNSELKAAVETAKKLKEKDYSQESFKQLKNALTAAEKVLKDKKASQAEIDEALANLNAAVDGLKTVDVKPIPPKPGASGDNVKNGFKVLESIMNVFINLLKGNNR